MYIRGSGAYSVTGGNQVSDKSHRVLTLAPDRDAAQLPCNLERIDGSQRPVYIQINYDSS